MPDITPEQVASSKQHFESALAGVEVFKRVLDLHTARWFVDTLKVNGRGKSKVNIFDEMLRSGELFEWAHGRAASPVTHTAMAKAGCEAVERAATAAVKSGSSIGNWSSPKSFMAAVREHKMMWSGSSKVGLTRWWGTRPMMCHVYELGEGVSAEIAFYSAMPLYAPSLRGARNLYKLFICRAAFLTCSHGYLSFIVPMSLLGDDQAAPIRELFLRHMGLKRVEAFPQKDRREDRVFREAKLSTAVFVTLASPTPGAIEVRTHLEG